MARAARVAGAGTPSAWGFALYGWVAELRLPWREFTNLPQTEVPAYTHCVTRGSRFDNRWGGMLARELLSGVIVPPIARQVMVHAEYGYPWNVAVAAGRGRRRFSLRHARGTFAPEHSYPLRLVVPHLYRGGGRYHIHGASDILRRPE